VVFHSIEIVDFRTVYSRDYHGWRDTRETCRRAINAFTCSDDRMISDASFISAVDNVTYTLEISMISTHPGGRPTFWLQLKARWVISDFIPSPWTAI